VCGQEADLAGGRVLAISDLHLDHPENLRAFRALPPHPEDWLLLAGDIGPREEDLQTALEVVAPRFRRVVWTPGNHDLWTLPGEKDKRVGEEKYHRLVSICRAHGVLTPEDPYAVIHREQRSYVVAPVFVLYDYSFRPASVPLEQAVAWAGQEDILCTDEYLLHPDPYPSRSRWCEARCQLTEERLSSIPREHRVILINHFPLREDLVRIRIPRFRIWCGTRRTEQWHTRYNVAVVVTGHLHVRATDVIDSVRFEEVSLGYPRQWRSQQGIEGYLRQVLPSEDQHGGRE
jgi:predicted phosphodiesterase